DLNVSLVISVVETSKSGWQRRAIRKKTMLEAMLRNKFAQAIATSPSPECTRNTVAAALASLKVNRDPETRSKRMWAVAIPAKALKGNSMASDAPVINMSVLARSSDCGVLENSEVTNAAMPVANRMSKDRTQ